MSDYSPTRWANEITILLNAAENAGLKRFPVDVESLAIGYSKQRFPNDPICRVIGDSLEGFEGALFKSNKTGKGWGIFYNTSIKSPGRIRFTLAHEFGHYLVHRLKHPNGFHCS